MKVVSYVKNDDGVPVVVRTREVDLKDSPQDSVERLEALFDGVPTWGGQEWKTLSVEELLSIFQEAAGLINDLYEDRHDKAVEKHTAQNWLIRFWKERLGWKPPEVFSRDEIIEDMAKRCLALAEWMSDNQNKPFYADSNMSYLINKPRAVAERLSFA